MGAICVLRALNFFREYERDHFKTNSPGQSAVRKANIMLTPILQPKTLYIFLLSCRLLGSYSSQNRETITSARNRARQTTNHAIK